LRQSDEAATLAAATDAAARDGVACDGVANNETTIDGTMIDNNTTGEAASDAAVTDDAVADDAVADDAVADEAETNEVVADAAVADEAATDTAVADEAVADEAVADEVAADAAEADEVAADAAKTEKVITDEAVIRLYGTADDSIVDGPGIRFSIFTQGCSHRCAGCHNPDAQSFEGGTESTIGELWERIRANRLLKGITLTGGEPFEQAEPLVGLARRTRESGLTVWAYSGYRYEDLLAGVPSEAAALLLEQVDVLVDGPFIEALKSLDLRWKGSANQRIIDVTESRLAGQIVELCL